MSPLLLAAAFSIRMFSRTKHAASKIFSAFAMLYSTQGTYLVFVPWRVNGHKETPWCNLIQELWLDDVSLLLTFFKSEEVYSKRNSLLKNYELVHCYVFFRLLKWELLFYERRHLFPYLSALTSKEGKQAKRVDESVPQIPAIGGRVHCLRSGRPSSDSSSRLDGTKPPGERTVRAVVLNLVGGPEPHQFQCTLTELYYSEK